MKVSRRGSAAAGTEIRLHPNGYMRHLSVCGGKIHAKNVGQISQSGGDSHGVNGDNQRRRKLRYVEAVLRVVLWGSAA
jgi:hypothetical protein